MPKTAITVVYATGLVYTPDGGSPFDFGSVGEVRRQFIPDLGGERPSGTKAVLGYLVKTSFKYLQPDLVVDYENLSQLVNTSGELVITAGGQNKSYIGDFYLEHEIDYNSKKQIVFGCEVSGYVEIDELVNFSDRDAEILYSLTKLEHDFRLITEESSLTILTSSAGVSPYTTATIKTSGVHGYAVGDIGVISGHSQADYDGSRGVMSVVDSDEFTALVPVASPTNGTGGTIKRNARTLALRCDWKVEVYSDFTVNVYIRNFTGKEQSGGLSFSNYNTWKSSVSTFEIQASSNNPDITVASDGFGAQGFALNLSGVGDVSAFNPGVDNPWQLLATKTADSSWSDMFDPEVV